MGSNPTRRAARYQTHSPSSFLPLWSVFTRSSRICRCPLCVCMLSHSSRVQLFETPWTVTRQAPLSMRFSRQGHWSGLPCPPPEGLPDPGMETACLMSVSCIGRQVLYQWCQLGSLQVAPMEAFILCFGPVPLTFFMSSLGLSGIQVITDGQVVFLVLCDKIVHFK